MKEIRDMEVRPGSAASGGTLSWRGRRYRCALGRGGVRDDKAEGDGASPAGRFFLRRVFYRDDWISRPDTGLPVREISPRDGWCDDPGHADYNRLITLAAETRHEKLWRDDHLYDLLVEIGHNDDPPRAGLGSAIFIHVAAPGFTPTEGCVAIALKDLLAILRDCDAGTAIRIHKNLRSGAEDGGAEADKSSAEGYGFSVIGAHSHA